MSLSGAPESFVKHDQEKNRLDLIPSEALLEVGKVLTFGAKKYSDENWRAPGMTWLRYWGAAQRHLHAWKLREDTDPETGLSHLAHAIACLLFILTAEILKLGKDDRWKP